MLPNPLRSHLERKTSAMLTRVGWEPPQTWPVPRPGREPLVFQTRLPAAEFVAVEDLPEDERRTPASVGGPPVALEEAARAEHVFLAVALRSRATSRAVLATMTAALAQQPLPFLDDAGIPQGRRARRRLRSMVGSVSVIERQQGEAPAAREPDAAATSPPAVVDPDAPEPAPPPLTVQYAIRTRHGVLTLTFHAEGHGIAQDFGRRLFMDVARGSHLGPTPLVPTRS